MRRRRAAGRYAIGRARLAAGRNPIDPDAAEASGGIWPGGTFWAPALVDARVTALEARTAKRSLVIRSSFGSDATAAVVLTPISAASSRRVALSRQFWRQLGLEP